MLPVLDEEIAEIREALAGGGGPERLEHDVGDLALVCKNLARYLNIGAESLEFVENKRFARPFRRLGVLLMPQAKRPEDSTLEETDW